MPTIEETTQNGSNAPSAKITQVQVRFVAEQEAEQHQLEEDAEHILQVVEAAGVVLGPVIACNFADGAIELDFTVESRSSSEVHQRVALIMSIIEQEIPIAREFSSQTASAPLVCA